MVKYLFGITLILISIIYINSSSKIKIKDKKKAIFILVTGICCDVVGIVMIFNLFPISYLMFIIILPSMIYSAYILKKNQLN